MHGNPLRWMQHDSCRQIVINKVVLINPTPISSPPLPPRMQYCAPHDRDDARVCMPLIPSLYDGMGKLVDIITVSQGNDNCSHCHHWCTYHCQRNCHHWHYHPCHCKYLYSTPSMYVFYVCMYVYILSWLLSQNHHLRNFILSPTMSSPLSS